MNNTKLIPGLTELAWTLMFPIEVVHLNEKAPNGFAHSFPIERYKNDKDCYTFMSVTRNVAKRQKWGTLHIRLRTGGHVGHGADPHSEYEVTRSRAIMYSL